MKKVHIVPLSTQAAEVLRTLHLVTGHGRLLFPGERDHEKSISNNTILSALKRMGSRNRVASAYDHSKYLKQRAAMMQTWADRLDQFRAGAKILPFKAA